MAGKTKVSIAQLVPGRAYLVLTIESCTEPKAQIQKTLILEFDRNELPFIQSGSLPISMWIRSLDRSDSNRSKNGKIKKQNKEYSPVAHVDSQQTAEKGFK
ncbi:LOW QUALITY PROTEIN: hypothetical protein DASC09_025920 [Saccharomycopsis crataegensis]|uniref:Uncharacterized protein n=1 Tax=Saccharomycopsis crataegensis TaxID=43959 RepID=A0AAV5QKW0_9ASCO|nr:LOW QUALITY PROTEIN: hypothetical protein DASC09_025920 [Saccharomycopsis crataegensis]